VQPYVYPDPLKPSEIGYRDLTAVAPEHSEDPSTALR
jgi:hypothetical protein